jgi:hypothetical protein
MVLVLFCMRLTRDVKSQKVPVLFNLTIPSATLIVIMYKVIVPILYIVNNFSTILNSSKVLPT